jgi:hypothetical protein
MANVNAQYNVAAPDSFAIRLAGRMRRRMFERFLELAGVREADEILDVGATSDRSYDSSNYLEKWYPHKPRITAVGLDDAAFLTHEFPGLRFCRANGITLPFRDRSFDVVHSSAVLEHVGSAANQRAFVAELMRVARRAVFLTTPNRWFPVEFHSGLPLVHWLPKPLFRALLRKLGHRELSQEAHLNLLGARELLRLAPDGARVESVRLIGWPSNLLLVIDLP